jgi:hypothetical protein
MKRMEGVGGVRCAVKWLRGIERRGTQLVPQSYFEIKNAEYIYVYFTPS